MRRYLDTSSFVECGSGQEKNMTTKNRLNADRIAIRNRMMSGERMDYLTVWRSTETGSKNWAFDTLKMLHRENLIHIVEWRRGSSGGSPSPLYAWGRGTDAAKPVRYENKEKCRRYVEKLKAVSPDKYEAQRLRQALRDRKSPLMDPIIAAMLGYARHGKGWTKRKIDEQKPQADHAAT